MDFDWVLVCVRAIREYSHGSSHGDIMGRGGDISAFEDIMVRQDILMEEYLQIRRYHGAGP